MRTNFFAVVIFPLLLGISFLPTYSKAFVGSRSVTKKRSQSSFSSPRLKLSEKESKIVLLPRLTTSRAFNAALQGRKVDDGENDFDGDTNNNKNAFSMLSTARDNKPNQGNFFYNDEVISHLYGYMYLVGFFVAQDSIFLGSFFVASSLAAWATQEELLPCNPRVPAIVAALTLVSTLVLRHVIGFEPPLDSILGESYQGPTEYSALFELAICLLNVGWGFFGSWRTKEQINGATYGF